MIIQYTLCHMRSLVWIESKLSRIFEVTGLWGLTDVWCPDSIIILWVQCTDGPWDRNSYFDFLNSTTKKYATKTVQASSRNSKLNIKHIIIMNILYKYFKNKGSSGEANMSQLVVLGTVWQMAFLRCPTLISPHQIHLLHLHQRRHCHAFTSSLWTTSFKANFAPILFI